MISQSDVIYFVVTDRFCDGDRENNVGVVEGDLFKYQGGDFRGIVEKIPYLKNLGVTALWITPVYLSVGRCGGSDGSDGYHGYWALDFDKVDPHLYSSRPDLVEGSRMYLKQLVDELHKSGIKVILDMVVNHTGYHNDTYMSYPGKKIQEDWFNSGAEGDVVKGSLCGLPDLNLGKVDVVDYFVNNILEWIEQTGIDGIRMDTVKHVERAFWYFFKSYIRGRYKNITLIGEDLEYDVYSISQYQKDHDFDTLFDFPLCSVIKEVFIRNGSMTLIAKPRLNEGEVRGVLDHDRCYTNANRLVTLLDNHDLDRRFMTEILDFYGHWDRDLAVKVFKLCLSFLFTTRGIPQIYYGSEIGLEGGRDPDNRRSMPQELFGVDLEPREQYGNEKEIFSHLKKLITLRKTNSALTEGYLFTLFSDQFVYAFMREFKGNIIVTVINNGLDDMLYPLEIHVEKNSNIPVRIKKEMKSRQVLVNLLDSGDKIDLSMQGSLSVLLEGKSAKIYSLIE